MQDKIQYTIIKSEEQYQKYCTELEDMVFQEGNKNEDTIELITLLIEKWDSEHYSPPDQDPVELLKLLMNEHDLKAKDMTGILKLSKGTVSKILNYRKGISKETIRRLSEYFSVRQEAFNRPYQLEATINKSFSRDCSNKCVCLTLQIDEKGKRI